MALDKNSVSKAVETCLADGKGKRKFTQSIDLAFGFKDVDFKKTENRFTLNVVLPLAPKPVKVLIYADEPVASQVKDKADLVLSSSDIQTYAKNKKKTKELLDYASLAEPKLMAVVGKALAPVLGPAGRLPKPLPPGANVAPLVDIVRRSVTLKIKGKFLPCVHCIIGNEGMTAEDLTENAQAVLEAVLKQVNEHQIKSVFVKTTMGKPVRIK